MPALASRSITAAPLPDSPVVAANPMLDGDDHSHHRSRRRRREPPIVADITRYDASLRRFLHGLPGVDQVGAEARAAGLGTRSIKTTAKA